MSENLPFQGTPPRDPDLREVPKWARRYAENRALEMLVAMAAVVLASALIAGLSALAATAWVHGKHVLGVIVGLIDLTLCVWWAWVCLTRRLQPLLAAGGKWFYRAEGDVAAPAPAARNKRRDAMVSWGFLIAIVATVGVAGKYDIPSRYLQPITVLYAVPFMLYLSLTRASLGRPFLLLWPVLYTLHGALVLAGVPLLRGINPMLAVLLPMTVYQLVAVLASHLYGRHALRRLRTLVQTAGAEGGDADDDA